jgi:hypothetical protein
MKSDKVEEMFIQCINGRYLKDIEINTAVVPIRLRMEAL